MEPFGEASIDFQSGRFSYSRPSNKIYVEYFMYPVFLFRPSIYKILSSGE